MTDAASNDLAGENLPKADAKPVARRTQEQRTREMRRRLINATIKALDKYGYAGATISIIVSEAGVSRGAHLHHFESKAALIEAAADHLVRKIFKSLGDSVPATGDPESRLKRLVYALWDSVFLTRDGNVVLELLIAARTDKELAEQLGVLMARMKDMYASAARHYFRAKPNADLDVEDIIFLTQWQLRGMLLDAPLLKNQDALYPHLDRWIAMMDRFIAPRKGVDGPPPRPEWWDKTK